MISVYERRGTTTTMTSPQRRTMRLKSAMIRFTMGMVMATTIGGGSRHGDCSYTGRDLRVRRLLVSMLYRLGERSGIGYPHFKVILFALHASDNLSVSDVAGEVHTNTDVRCWCIRAHQLQRGALTLLRYSRSISSPERLYHA
jgi:hypothetical protein